MNARVRVGQIGPGTREVTLHPDASTRAALAERLGLEAVTALSCQFRLSRPNDGPLVLAEGRLSAEVVQCDVRTLASFSAKLAEAFQLRFMPEADLPQDLDLDDPVDDVGYTDGMIDLDEAMAQQLALALDPYPRAG